MTWNILLCCLFVFNLSSAAPVLICFNIVHIRFEICWRSHWAVFLNTGFQKLFQNHSYVWNKIRGSKWWLSFLFLGLTNHLNGSNEPESVKENKCASSELQNLTSCSCWDAFVSVKRWNPVLPSIPLISFTGWSERELCRFYGVLLPPPAARFLERRRCLSDGQVYDPPVPPRSLERRVFIRNGPSCALTRQQLAEPRAERKSARKVGVWRFTGLSLWRLISASASLRFRSVLEKPSPANSYSGTIRPQTGGGRDVPGKRRKRGAACANSDVPLWSPDAHNWVTVSETTVWSVL